MHPRTHGQVNPHNEKDIIFVPYTVPAPCSYADEVAEYASTFGLASNADGSCAIQQVELLVPYVITRDHHRQGRTLEWFELNDFEILLQGDGARRGIKAFCQWVFKNQYMRSESAALVHLICLALGMKDDATGAMSAWGDQLPVIASIDGRVWDIPDPLGSDRIYKIRTTLGMTLDLHAERLFFGIMAGGCECNTFELQHGFPSNHRLKLYNIRLVLVWVARCKEPPMQRHIALAHEIQPNSDCPDPCPACPLYNGTIEQRRAANDIEWPKYLAMVAAADESLAGKKLLDDASLDHAHKHFNVRWRKRGIPPIPVPKALCFLELLHSVPLNACKLQCKHASLKYMPCEIRLVSQGLFHSWGVPIDTAKPDKRTQEKWPGGGTVQYLVEGGNGKSPGFAVVGAKLTWVLAEYLLKEKLKREADAETAQKAVEAAAAETVAAATTAKAAAIGANIFSKPGSKNKGTSALHLTGKSNRQPAAAKSTSNLPSPSATPPPAAKSKEVKHEEYETIPLESQGARATPEQVAIIKGRYGEYLGQRMLTTLISYDTFRTAWLVAYKRLALDATQDEKDAHACAWFHEWADWIEAIERVANHNFRSWVPHRLLHKGTRQIAKDGDLWCKSTGALEANQAEMGRTLDAVSSRRRSIDTGEEKTSTVVRCKDCDGNETTRVKEAKVTSSMALSAAKHFTAAGAFRVDEENRILQRGTQRLVLGAEGRSTAPHQPEIRSSTGGSRRDVGVCFRQLHRK